MKVLWVNNSLHSQVVQIVWESPRLVADEEAQRVKAFWRKMQNEDTNSTKGKQMINSFCTLKLQIASNCCIFILRYRGDAWRKKKIRLFCSAKNDASSRAQEWIELWFQVYFTIWGLKSPKCFHNIFEDKYSGKLAFQISFQYSRWAFNPSPACN